MTEPAEPAWHVVTWTRLLATLDAENDALIEPNTTALRVGMTSVIRRLSLVPIESYAPVQPLHNRLRAELLRDFLSSDLPAATDARSFGYEVYVGALDNLQMSGAEVDTALESDAFGTQYRDFLFDAVRPLIYDICEQLPQTPMWARFLDTIEEEEEEVNDEDEGDLHCMLACV